MTLVIDGMSRLYPKSWGADYVRAGEVRFRLWSPSSEQIDLQLCDSIAPMTPQEDGWFELLATGVVAGSAYSYLLPGGRRVPDPASRAQHDDVHGPSLVVDPTAYAWKDEPWRGRPWEEAVIYELHIGTFTPEGTFRSAMTKLDYLAELGVTALEIMPVAQFGGNRGWGYDGVLLYAPHRAYGSPEDMKAFVDAAHGKGLMVFLDVVYNHFGPDGNYLPLLAPDFFDRGRSTPWGAAIAYERRAVRDFFIENALYWLDEFHLDGLRFDAADQIRDPKSSPEILEEIASRVRGEFPDRTIHLITEDNRNVTHLHARGPEGRPTSFTAEWNDDFHTAAHVFATGETAGYFADFRDAPLSKLARTLTEGFAYQGEPSAHRNGERRGEPSRHLPPSAFVNFLQNHDQVGNRAFGERLGLLTDPVLVQCLTAILILTPGTPLLFMGEEWGETRPFLFFTDFEGELAAAVRTGRRREFSAFLREDQQIPDPNDISSFESSKLNWAATTHEPHSRVLSYIRHLLRVRQRHLVPLFAGMRESCGKVLASENGSLAVDWVVDNTTLSLRANLTLAMQPYPPAKGTVVFQGPSLDERFVDDGRLSPMSVLLTREEG
jgi:maltooligosyltrehalose trehalohydrolase